MPIDRKDWGFAVMSSFQRPLSAIMEAISKAGLVIERLLEPRLDPEFAKKASAAQNPTPSYCPISLTWLWRAGDFPSESAILTYHTPLL